MAAGKKDDYFYCNVCRKNHNDGRKHIFHQQHKSKLAEILGKFSKKVRSARQLLQKPRLIDGELEPDLTLWCYCCQEDVQKHVSDGQTTIEWGGLIEHMASSSHHKKTRHYWWYNGADGAQLQNFILFQAELDRFKSLVEEQLEKLNTAREKKLKEIAKEIEQVEKMRSQMASELPFVASTISTYQHGRLDGSMTIKTQSAQNGSKIRGNIHTGATPPWLRDDDDDDDDGQGTSKIPIGPSEDDFRKWREKQGKGGKNPKRVGADFHYNLKKQGLLDKDDDAWLPSFGRVWNYGPRSHSKMEFKNESSTSATSNNTPSDNLEPNISSSTVSLSSLSVQPYIRRRSIKRPHSVIED